MPTGHQKRNTRLRDFCKHFGTALPTNLSLFVYVLRVASRNHAAVEARNDADYSSDDVTTSQRLSTRSAYLLVA